MVLGYCPAPFWTHSPDSSPAGFLSGYAWSFLCDVWTPFFPPSLFLLSIPFPMRPSSILLLYGEAPAPASRDPLIHCPGAWPCSWCGSDQSMTCVSYLVSPDYMQPPWKRTRIEMFPMSSQRPWAEVSIELSKQQGTDICWVHWINQCGAPLWPPTLAQSTHPLSL